MSSQNGNGKRILSLDDKRMVLPRKGNDFITVAQAQQMVVEETTKVHEYYLEQIPPYVARMIQDALMSYGLIKLTDEASGALQATGEAPVVSENTGGDTAPADSAATPEAAAEGPSGLLPKVPPIEITDGGYEARPS